MQRHAGDVKKSTLTGPVGSSSALEGQPALPMGLEERLGAEAEELAADVAAEEPGAGAARRSKRARRPA